MKKKFISVILAVCLMMSCLTVGAMSVSAATLPSVEVKEYASRADFIQAYNSGNSVDEFSGVKEKVYQFTLDSNANVIFAATSMSDYGNSSAIVEVFTDINCTNEISLENNTKYDAAYYGYLKAGTYYLKVSTYSENDVKCVYVGQVKGNEIGMSLSFVKDNSNKTATLQFKLSDKAVPESVYVSTNNYGESNYFPDTNKCSFNTANNQFSVSYANSAYACTNVKVIDENGFEYFKFARVLSKYTAKINGSTDVEYTGKAVKLSSKNITIAAGYEAVPYTASYKNNKNIGKATVTFTGKGNCIGKYTTTFNILPGKVKKLNISTKTGVKTNNYKFSWSASKGATKYVIQARKSNGGSYKTVKTVKSKSTSIKLKNGLTYIQVYGIKKVGGKTYKSSAIERFVDCNYSSFTRRYNIYAY